MIKVRIKVRGLKVVEEAIGGRETVIEFEGNSLGDFIRAVDEHYGVEVRKAMLVQVLKNNRHWVKHEDLSTPLEDGDTLSFFNMVAGG